MLETSDDNESIMDDYLSSSDASFCSNEDVNFNILTIFVSLLQWKNMQSDGLNKLKPGV